MKLKSRSAISWNFTQLKFLVCYRSFGATCRSHYAAQIGSVLPKFGATCPSHLLRCHFFVPRVKMSFFINLPLMTFAIPHEHSFIHPMSIHPFIHCTVIPIIATYRDLGPLKHTLLWQWKLRKSIELCTTHLTRTYLCKKPVPSPIL